MKNFKANLAKYRKPQYKALGNIKNKAVKALTDWFMEEYELPGCHARTLAEEVIERTIRQKQDAIHPTAPDVLLPEQSLLEGVLMDAKKLSLEMNEKNELEAILDNEARHEEREKHGV